jgi:hypothetical protein
MQEHMVKGFPAHPGRLHKNPEVFHNARLTRKIDEFGRPQYLFDLEFRVRQMFAGCIQVFIHGIVC